MTLYLLVSLYQTCAEPEPFSERSLSAVSRSTSESDGHQVDNLGDKGTSSTRQPVNGRYLSSAAECYFKEDREIRVTEESIEFGME